MNTKTRSTPVVEKKEEKKGCECKGCDCGCGCQCGCGGSGSVRTLLLCGTVLVSAFLIAGSIFLKPCNAPEVQSLQPVDSVATTQETEDAIQNFIRNNPEVLVETLGTYYRSQEETIRNFIKNNPELLVESFETYYKAKEAKAAKEAKVQAKKAEPREFKLENLPKADEALVQKIIDDKTNYSLGNKDGKFVIIEFFDYKCGWCKRTNKALEKAIAKPEGKNIRWIPIDTPIFGESSELIARYVLAAGEQGKYAEMHAAVGNAEGSLNEATLLELAKGLNLNTKKLTADANGEKIKAKLESNNEYRDKLDIRGVPMVIVDGRINGGALFGDALDVVVKASSQK